MKLGIIDLNSSINIFLENALKLNDYAKKRGIVFTIETIPPRAPTDWHDRKHSKPQNIYELPLEAIFKAADLGLFIANDFEHTAANFLGEANVFSARSRYHAEGGVASTAKNICEPKENPLFNSPIPEPYSHHAENYFIVKNLLT